MSRTTTVILTKWANPWVLIAASMLYRQKIHPKTIAGAALPSRVNNTRGGELPYSVKTAG